MIYVFIKNNEKIFDWKDVQSITSRSKELLSMKANLFLIGNKELCLVKKKITSIYFESKQRYSSPRMTVELAS
jgi:hypothetical protein